MRRAVLVFFAARVLWADAGVLIPAEARRSSVFSARVVPIPAWGTKRLEIEYQERLPLERGEALLAIPLRPDAYRAQAAGKLSILVDFKSAHALRDSTFVSKLYPMNV